MNDTPPLSDSAWFAFEVLTAGLAKYWLPCSNGDYKVASPDEFMYMGSEGQIHHFKHIGTRNYIHARMENGLARLSIPVGGAFHAGFFD